jgi:chaperone required for assembly of F1-ATPase
MPFNRAKPENAERPRRFWKEASVGPRGEGGWPVLLDGRQARTPGGKPLALPTEALAALVAAEWAAQGEQLNLASMPATRLAHTAIEAVPARREAVAEEIASYAGADLLSYHAEEPAVLARLHVQDWGPLLDWSERELGVKLLPTAGIIHLPQPPESLERAKALALELDDFALTALAAATPLFGSAVLAFALQRGRLSADEAFDLSRLDEAFQESQWGVDDEAAQRTANRRAEAQALGAWFRGLGR